MAASRVPWLILAGFSDGDCHHTPGTSLRLEILGHGGVGGVHNHMDALVRSSKSHEDRVEQRLTVWGGAVTSCLWPPLEMAESVTTFQPPAL